jgi:hypothetical protein
LPAAGDFQHFTGRGFPAFVVPLLREGKFGNPGRTQMLENVRPYANCTTRAMS